MADQNATIGSNVTFNVDANGAGLTYQWQKQDANGTWVNIGGATGSSYTINSVQAIHAGIYRVAITNASGGTTYSSNSVLNVAGSPPTNDRVKWMTTLGAEAQGTPAIDGDTIYTFGASEDTNSSTLFAVNRQTGAIRWQRGWASVAMYGEETSPVVGANGTIYIVSNNGKAYAVDRNGTEIWSTTWADNPIQPPYPSTPALSPNGTLYFGTQNHSGKFFALNSTNGAILWEKTGISEMAPIIVSGTVYVTAKYESGAPDHRPRIIALNDFNGSTIWEYGLTAEANESWNEWNFSSSNSVMIHDGNRTLYVGLMMQQWRDTRTPSWLYAIDTQSKSLKWRKQLTDNQEEINGLSLGPAGGHLYVTGKGKHAYCFDAATGNKLWEYISGNNNEELSATALVGADNTIYLTAEEPGKILAINGQSGSLSWEYNVGGEIEGSPTMDNNGTLYFNNEDTKKLYALKTDSPRLAVSPWPKFMANIRNTGYFDDHNSSFTPPTITSQPTGSFSVVDGGTANFSVDATGDGLTYQWQKQDANGTWVNIDGATSANYQILSVSALSLIHI